MVKVKKRHKRSIAPYQGFLGVRLVETSEFSLSDCTSVVYGVLAVEPSSIHFLNLRDWDEDSSSSVYLVSNSGTYEIWGGCGNDIARLKNTCIAIGLKDNGDGTYGTRPEYDMTGA